MHEIISNLQTILGHLHTDTHVYVYTHIHILNVSMALIRAIKTKRSPNLCHSSLDTKQNAFGLKLNNETSTAVSTQLNGTCVPSQLFIIVFQ